MSLTEGEKAANAREDARQKFAEWEELFRLALANPGIALWNPMPATMPTGGWPSPSINVQATVENAAALAYTAMVQIERTRQGWPGMEN